MRGLGYAIAVLAVMSGAVAQAGEPGGGSDGEGERPWAAGVSSEDQATAEGLFAEGTDLFKDAFFSRAVEAYRKALSHWDHPAIHFNLAKALMNMEQPAAAYTHLESSMKYGGEPLDSDQIKQVKRYTKLLYDNELAELIVDVPQPGVRVTMGGEELVVGPGRWTGVVEPDRAATIIASKLGFQTKQLEPTLERGQVNDLLIELVALDQATRFEREFDAWIPWAVIGGGVAVLAGGGVLTWQSSESFDTYDRQVAACNAESPFEFTDDRGVLVSGSGSRGACMPSGAITSSKDDGALFQTLATAAYVTGGAILTTGVVLLVVNRERPVEVEGEVIGVTVVPFASPDGAGVSATLGF